MECFVLAQSREASIVLNFLCQSFAENYFVKILRKDVVSRQHSGGEHDEPSLNCAKRVEK